MKTRVGVNDLTRALKNNRVAPPVTVHLRQKGGQIYNSYTHHDIVTLHFRLFIGQFIVLHFETVEKTNSVIYTDKSDIGKQTT